VAEKTIKWADAPTQDDLIDAAEALTLVGIERVTLNQAPKLHPAKDLLRFAQLPALPQDNKGAAKWLKKIENGNEVPPVLLVRGKLAIGLPLVIAEGYHRVSACHLLDEKTPVFGFFLSWA